MHAASASSLVAILANRLRGVRAPWRSSESRSLQGEEPAAGVELLERSYRAALEHGYLWHEFGDLHLILP